MEASPLLQKVQNELEVLESIYSEDGVVHQPASEAADGSVECEFKL